nr:hypothetical protein [Tanacetum cinerariifolium]
MHNDVDDLIESALNSTLLSINLKSQLLDKEKQKVKNIVEQATKRRTRITESLQNFRVIHKKSSIYLNNTSQISPINQLHPEYEVTSDNESECDVPVCEDSSTFDVLKDHFEILSDSNNDDTSSDDDAFKDIEYVEASLPDSELISLEEENDVYQEEKEVFFNFEPDTGVLTTKVVKGISEHYVLMPNILPTLPTLDPNLDFTPSYDSIGFGNKIFDLGIFIEVQPERLLSREEFSISFTFDPLYPLYDTLLPFSSKNKDKVFKPGILSYLLLQGWGFLLGSDGVSSGSGVEVVEWRKEWGRGGCSDKVFQANHSVQNEESSNEIAVSNFIQEKEEPPQDYDIRQLIRKECYIEASKEQKQSMEDTMLALVKICQEKEFLCIHDDVDDLIKSALNSKILLINSNSQHLDKKEQEVKNAVEQPVERITPKMESDEVIESNAENLLPILSKCKVTLEDKREFYVDDFEDIEYIEASLSDYEIVSVEEDVVQQEEEEVDLEDISQIQDPEFETFCDHSEETRSGNTTHADNSLPEYDSFCFEIEPDQDRLINLVKNDIPDDPSNNSLLEEAVLFLFDNSIPPDNPSIPRPPPELADAETNAGEEIPVAMNDKDKDVDYSSFIFVIFDKVFSLLSAESEDTIFDPGISD